MCLLQVTVLQRWNNDVHDTQQSFGITPFFLTCLCLASVPRTDTVQRPEDPHIRADTETDRTKPKSTHSSPQEHGLYLTLPQPGVCRTHSCRCGSSVRAGNTLTCLWTCSLRLSITKYTYLAQKPSASVQASDLLSRARPAEGNCAEDLGATTALLQTCCVTFGKSLGLLTQGFLEPNTFGDTGCHFLVPHCLKCNPEETSTFPALLHMVVPKDDSTEDYTMLRMGAL